MVKLSLDGFRTLQPVEWSRLFHPHNVSKLDTFKAVSAILSQLGVISQHGAVAATQALATSGNHCESPGFFCHIFGQARGTWSPTSPTARDGSETKWLGDGGGWWGWGMRVEGVGIGLERRRIGRDRVCGWQCSAQLGQSCCQNGGSRHAPVLLRVHHSDKQIQTEDAPILGF